jgi:catechol 2,3-dioxygenase
MAVAHIGHIELLVTDLDGSCHFFSEVVGLTVSLRETARVFQWAWQDWDHHTPILTRGNHSAAERVG